MYNMYKIYIFDKVQNWIPMTTIQYVTEAQAQKFVDDYPRWGCDHSRTIRNGNWQIRQEK